MVCHNIIYFSKKILVSVLLTYFSSICNLLLFQFLPIEEPIKGGLLSGRYAENKYNLVFGMASSALGYAIYPENLLEEMDQLQMKVISIYSKASKGRKRAHQSPLSRPFIVFIISFLFSFFTTLFFVSVRNGMRISLGRISKDLV
jgi:hypothetical protein